MTSNKDEKANGKTGWDEGQAVDGLDFGIVDDELASILKPSGTTQRSFDVSEFFEEDEPAPDVDAPQERTTVVSPADTKVFDAPTSVSGSVTPTGSAEMRLAGAAETTSGKVVVENEPLTTVFGDNAIDPETFDEQLLEAVGSSEPVVITEEPPATTGGIAEEESPEDTGDAMEDPDDRTTLSGEVKPSESDGDSAERKAAPAPASVAEAEAETKRPPRKGLVGALVAIVVVIAVAGGVMAFANPAAEPSAESSSSSASEAAEPEPTYTVEVSCVDRVTKAALQKATESDYGEDDMPQSVKAPEITGYSAIEATDNGETVFTRADFDEGKPCVVDLSGDEPGDHDIVFTYSKITSYTVRYLENGTDAEVAAPKVVDNVLSGDPATEAAAPSETHNLTSPDTETIQLADDPAGNVITFRYDKKPTETPTQSTPVQTYSYNNSTYGGNTSGGGSSGGNSGGGGGNSGGGNSGGGNSGGTSMDGTWGSAGGGSKLDGSW